MEVFNQQLDNLIKYLDCRLDFYYSVPFCKNLVWWLILSALLKNWLVEGVASEVNDFTANGNSDSKKQIATEFEVNSSNSYSDWNATPQNSGHL